MDRSPGFGSTMPNLTRSSHSISLRFTNLLVLNLARHRKSSDRSTKSTLSHLNVLQLFVNTGFQGLFHSPLGVLFTFPSQYFFTIGYHGVFRLGGWSPRIPAGFLVSHSTLDPVKAIDSFAYATFTLYGLGFPASHSARVFGPTLPARTPKDRSLLVWPLPLSLATTDGISVDFFS